MRYEDSIRQIKGVGEKAEQRFHKLDIWNVGRSRKTSVS